MVVIAFTWLMIKSVGLAFKLTWGAAKVAASILMAIAVPLLIMCAVFVGGIILLLPVAIIAIALGILKACV